MSTTSYEIASRIMGDNFCGIDSIKKIGAKIGDSNSDEIGIIPYSAEELATYSETHILIFCGSMSLIDVWSNNQELFFDKTHPWFENPNQRFSTIATKQKWLMLAKAIYPKSTSKTWEEQTGCLENNQFVPSASELAQVIIAHYKLTGTKLFDELYARTSDIDASNRHVSLGRFREYGLVAGRDMVSGQVSNIGLAYGIKPDN